MNERLAQDARPVYTFEQFVNEVYLPFGRRSWKESTAETSEQIIKTHLVTEFGRLFSMESVARSSRIFWKTLALRWKSVARERLWVDERVYKRILNTPKNGKARAGAISDGTLALLSEWADLTQDPSPEGFVFRSENLSTPLSPTISGGGTCDRRSRKSD